MAAPREKSAAKKVAAKQAARATKPSASKSIAKKTANKTVPTAVSVDAYVDQVDHAIRRRDARTLIEMMGRITGESPKMWGPSIVGFGSYHYRYESGREGDMPIAAFSPRKPATVVYVLGDAPGTDRLLAKLGPHSMGKACLYLKNLDEVDLGVLEEIIAKSVADVRTKYGA